MSERLGEDDLRLVDGRLELLGQLRRLELDGQLLDLRIVRLGVVHAGPDPGAIRRVELPEVQVDRQQAVADDLVDLLAAQEEPVSAVLGVMEELHLAGAAFLPLFRAVVESVELGALAEHWRDRDCGRFVF